jgi:hypothetical protein
MAHGTPESPVGDAKFSSDIGAAPHGIHSREEEALARPDDFDVETVERVYRKLDLRIIPGRPPLTDPPCHDTTD